ncbi:uncharacterized protein LOC119106873 [Pollicipes pollicipes]|uniref:uncharacterized protein LOC119106873 n=1 Tax=Pollicipes pollicipes TaxID=41117 RepID=UPI001884BDB4|nr:uncharacterized protein LOC119106873 [Pollicipes pollicipes]
MNTAVIQIKFLLLFLSALMLAVDLTLFCFVQYNILHMSVFQPEAAVQSAHIAAEVTTMLNCIMCFADCYVTCFERAHSRRHVKALVCAVVSVCIFMSNTASYFYIAGGKYQYAIPTKNITAFNPDNMQDIWLDEIHAYLSEYENSRNANKTKANSLKYLVTLDYFQQISHCCGVISFADYTTLGVPIPKTCECGTHESILHSCTRGKKTSTGGRSFVGGMIDMTQWRKYMGGGSPSDPAEDDRESRGGDDEYQLKREVHEDGCEEHRIKYVHVLSVLLRLLVSSNSLKFISIIMIPIPWLYEK